MGKFKRLLKRRHSFKNGGDEVDCFEPNEAGNSPSLIRSGNDPTSNGSNSTTSSERASNSEVKDSGLVADASKSNKPKTRPITSVTSGISEMQRKSARATGNLASGVVAGSGSQILWYFISSLGASSEKSLSQSWLPGGTTLSQEKSWVYEVQQGHGDLEMKTIRNQMNGRLYRTGNRLQGGGWSRLLLGEEFTSTPSKKQSHKLKFVVSCCVCLKCRIANVKTEQDFNDMDKMLQDAEHGIGFEEDVTAENDQESPAPDLACNESVSHNLSPNPNAVSISPEAIESLTEYTELSLLGNNLGLLGETLHTQEFELGTVSKISHKSAKVTFSKYAQKLLRNERYRGLLSAAEISRIVGEKSKEYFRQHKGKTVRRFYVCGTLHRIILEGASVVVFQPSRHTNGDEKRKEPIGVLFRRQLMSVFIGNLALEESFGSFIYTGASMYLGFGHDKEGAQSIYGKGRLGEARRLGINELRSHFIVQDGHNLVLEMY
ncbi:hypothetical protein FGB62_12g433 [Gracilaria domingensis]|nr:hypothetical protein FGB62_12g433 [Gracilaria domingensis]